MKKMLSITLDTDVFQKIEQLRGTKPHFRSEFINAALREKLSLDEDDKL